MPAGHGGILAADAAAGAPADVRRDWPALDGLRAIAVCAVMAGHVDVLPGGYLGVDVFFVLSGFLITSLLIGEWDRRGGALKLSHFYARRVLRLFPALGCVIVAAVALAVLLDLRGGVSDQIVARATFGGLPWVALFAGNIATVLHPGQSVSYGAFPLGVLSHTWSLAVEEQFYLLWPSLFIQAMRRRLSRPRLALLLAVLAIAEMIYRVLLATTGFAWYRIYFATDTHSDGLLLGCALAFWLTSGQSAWQGRVVRRLGKPAMWLASAVLLGLFAFGNYAGGVAEIAVAVLASGVLVTGIAVGEIPPVLERLLSCRLAIRTGRRSYGLYLWHVIFLMAAEALCAPSVGFFPASPARRLIFATALAVAVAASIIVADLSYRFVELPALRRKRRFQAAGPA